MEKEPKLIIVAGIKGSGSTFLFSAILEILKQAGHSFQSSIANSDGSWIIDGAEKPKLEETDLKEVDFHVLKCSEFSIPLEAKSSLIFTSTRDFTDYKEDGKYIIHTDEFCSRYRELIRWMRSTKHAYCMDYNSPINAKGLYNYNNLRNIILPLNYAFKPLLFNVNKEGKPVMPQAIIEALAPELKEKSIQQEEKLKKRIKDVKQNPNTTNGQQLEG